MTRLCVVALFYFKSLGDLIDPFGIIVHAMGLTASTSELIKIRMQSHYSLILIHAELWIGFTQLDYIGLEGDFVQPVVNILSGRIASGLTVLVHFQTAYLQATGELPINNCAQK